MRHSRFGYVVAPKISAWWTLSLIVLLCSWGPARGQLRIVTLNGANSELVNAGPRNPWMNTILSAIGSSVSDDPLIAGNTGIARPIDILCLQEVNAAATTSAAYAATLNALYPTANYQHGTLDGTSTGSGTQGIVYNANAVTLLGEATVGTASTSGQPRQALRYKLRVAGYDSASDFYIYNSHYKSATGSESRRTTEATAIRTNADALGANQRIIYLGDFNVYTSTEPMYTKLLSSGNGQAFDPINKPGDWDSTASFSNIHTQSPFSSTTATSLGTGFSGTTGGMDSRFDIQLISSNLNDNAGLAYIDNSYQSFGNNGTHGLNHSINYSTNTAQPKTVLDAMAGVLDHSPVVADYQLPAKLGVSFGTASARVIKGAGATISVTVNNAAPVSFANGADTLAYSVSGTGAVTGSASGTDAALGASNTHNIALDTTTAGAKSGNVTVASTSQEVAGNNQSSAVSYSVVDHATASFNASSAVTTLNIDYSYIPQGFTARTRAFAISNLVSTASYTAALDIDSITNSGSTTALGTNVAVTSNLAAGSLLNYTATATTATTGVFNSSHVVAVSDENIPGATAGTSLVINQSSRVIANGNFPVNGDLLLFTGESWNSGAASIATNVTINKTGAGTLRINGTQTHGANATLNVPSGNLIMDTDAGSASSSPLALNGSGGIITLNSSQHLRSLGLSNASTATLNGTRNQIATGALSITGNSRLDLRDGTMVVRTPGARAGVQALITAGRNGVDANSQVNWNGPGIYSSVARANNVSLLRDLYSVGVIRNGDLASYSGSTAYSTFFGTAVTNDDVLVAFTYNGDTNLDGQISFDDYVRIDSAYGGTAPANLGWLSGDFDADGVITFSDYVAIDTAYAYQVGGLSAQFLSTRQAVFGQQYMLAIEQSLGALNSVPEPGMLALLPMMLLAMKRPSSPARRR